MEEGKKNNWRGRASYMMAIVKFAIFFTICKIVNRNRNVYDLDLKIKSIVLLKSAYSTSYLKAIITFAPICYHL